MSTLALEKIGDVSVAVAQDALERRDSAVSWAQMFDEVTTPEQQVAAVEAMRPLKEIERQVEADRKAVKAPVLDLGRAVDDKAKDFIKPVVAELHRLSALVSHYQFEERKKAAEAEATRQAELRRQEEERRKAEAEARRIEAERQKAIEAGKPAPPPPAPLPPPPAPVTTPSLFREPPKPAGLSVKDKWQFEVLDAAAVYAARPDLCRIEVRTAEVNAAISAGVREIPGLRIWSELQANVR